MSNAGLFGKQPAQLFGRLFQRSATPLHVRPHVADFGDTIGHIAERERAWLDFSAPRDEATPLLIKLARSHAHPVVRKQAMFWLGQSKDPRALSFFEEVLR